MVDTSILEDEDESGTIDEMVKEAVKIIPVPDDLAQPIAENLVQSFIATRKAMPDVRDSKTTKSRVGGHTVYLTSSEYEDGRLGEIMITTSKEGRHGDLC